MYKEVQSEMIKFPYVASSGMNVKDALIYMKECKVRHLPVMEGSKLVGVISERDLSACENSSEKTLDQIMINNPFVVNQDESLATVVNVMAEKKYGCTLVTNSEGYLIGIFTTIDALKVLSKFLEGDSAFYNSYENIIPLKEVIEWI